MSLPIDHLDRSTSETVRRHAATFRRVRLARQAASDEASDARVPWPEVEVAQHEVSDELAPPAARKLAQAARDRGWHVSVVASRGTALAGRGQPGEVVDAVSVRCRRGDDAAVGYWRERRWAFGLARSEGRYAQPVQKGLLAFVLGASSVRSDEEAPAVR
jgi:hypothetical protein